MAHALILSIVVSIGHALSGRVDLTLAGALLVGAIPGVLIGAQIASRLPERAMKLTLATVLVGIGLQLTGAFPRTNAPARTESAMKVPASRT
jgi:uncharacterized protein